MLLFTLNSGLRVGELAGLRLKDIDKKEGLVHIRRQLVYKNFGDGCKLHVQDLKTDNAERDIPLNQDARKALTLQKQNILALGIQRKEIAGINDFVFINTAGKPNTISGWNAILTRMVNAYNRNVEQEDKEPLPHISMHTYFCDKSGGGWYECKNITEGSWT